MRRSLSRVVALVLACSACGGPERPPRLEQEGDPCNTGREICVDEDSALGCEEKVWTLLSCDELCARRGQSYVADGCDMGCVCVLADPDACVPGETTCIDGSTLGLCNEEQVLEPGSCEDTCADQELASLGCVPAMELGPGLVEPAACWCTSEGTPCDESEPVSCVDETSLKVCSGGVWVFEACTALCGSPGATCDPWLETPACAC